MTLTYLPTVRDAEVVAGWSLTHTATGRRMLSRATIVYIAFPFVLSAVTAIWSWELAVGFLVLCMVVLVVRGSPRSVMAKTLCRKIAKRTIAEHDLQSVQIRVDATSLQIEAENGVLMRYPLTAIARVEQSDDGVFVSTDKNLIRFIPARAFISPEARGVFCQRCGPSAQAAQTEQHADSRAMAAAGDQLTHKPAE